MLQPGDGRCSPQAWPPTSLLGATERPHRHQGSRPCDSREGGSWTERPSRPASLAAVRTTSPQVHRTQGPQGMSTRAAGGLGLQGRGCAPSLPEAPPHQAAAGGPGVWKAAARPIPVPKGLGLGIRSTHKHTPPRLFEPAGTQLGRLHRRTRNVWLQESRGKAGPEGDRAGVTGKVAGSQRAPQAAQGPEEVCAPRGRLPGAG